MKNKLLIFSCFLPLALMAFVDGQAPSHAETLTLKDCIAIALQGSAEMQQARADVLEKEALKSSSRKAFYPTLSGQYNYTRQLNGTSGSLSPSLDNTFSYGAQVAQPLYTGNRLTATDELRALDLTTAHLGLEVTRNDMVLRINSAYFDVLKAEKLEQVAEQAITRLQSHLKDSKAFYEAGLIPKNDMLQSEVQLAEGQQSLLQSQNATALARSVLNLLLQQPADDPLRLEDVLNFEPYRKSWEEIRQEALGNRAEREKSKVDIAKAERGVTIARAPFLPSVSLSATYTRRGDDVFASSYPYGSTDVRSAQAVANWEFWNWGRGGDEVFAAEQRVRKSEEAVRQTDDAIVLQARKAYLKLQETEKNIKVAEKAIVQAEENYRINEARFQAQLNTSTDVLDAENLLSRAKSNYYSAVYDNRVARATLDWATGGLAAN